MVNHKIQLYHQVKSLARTLNIATPTYRTATVVSLTNFINENSRPPPLPFLSDIRQASYDRNQRIRYYNNVGNDSFDIEIRPTEFILNNTDQELGKSEALKQLATQYLDPTKEYQVYYYEFIGQDAGYSKFENKIRYSPQRLRNTITINTNSTNKKWIELGKLFGKISVFEGEYDFVMRKVVYEIQYPLTFGKDHGSINEDNDVNITNANAENVIYRFVPLVANNQPLENQRDGEMNCACKIVLDELNKNLDKRNERKKKNIMKLNEKYLESGIDDEGLQELADKSLIQLIIKDKLGETWREFKPKAKGNYKKLLLVAHNNHISLEDPYDEDDEEESKEFKVVEVFDEEWKPIELRDKGQQEIWFDDSQGVVDMANEYENEGNEGMSIISKGQLMAYITPDVIWKTKFYEHEKYRA